jgi:hypothetical protein
VFKAGFFVGEGREKESKKNKRGLGIEKALEKLSKGNFPLSFSLYPPLCLSFSCLFLSALLSVSYEYVSMG